MRSKSEINLVSFQTIAKKEITRINRIWVQTLAPSVLMSTLYFVIFGSLIGSRVGEMDGLDYIAFIVPGLIMMAVINNSYTNTSSSFFGNKFQKSIEELLVSPTSNWVILLGYVMGGIYRGIIVGILVTIISLFFTKLTIVNIFILLSSVILTSTMFSIAGIINGIYARKFDDVGIVPLFILTPLTYFGGVFYSIKLLPEFWQYLSMLNPILYMVNAFRYGFFGISDVNIWFAFVMIILFIVVFFIWANYLLYKGYKMRN